jgi:regulator of protease activity HflC (stomatin/prohibitin superfamily)
MQKVREYPAFRLNGFVMLLLTLGLVGWGVYDLISLIAQLAPTNQEPSAGQVLWPVGKILFGLVILAGGLMVVQPNEARVLVFFGRYAGTVARDGFHWINPFASKKNISLRIRNFNSERLKVNDAQGNPIEIASVVVWRVTDAAKALFDVENYADFVAIQSETAIRSMAARHPYDTHENELSLRGNPDQIAAELRNELEERLEVVGVQVMEARLSHLAYAPEIAQAMLRRQQAQAVIAARQKIVEGAVGMVKQALEQLKSEGVVTLDEERKAAMVNNLLVALVSESEAQPILNAGSLY